MTAASESPVVAVVGDDARMLARLGTALKGAAFQVVTARLTQFAGEQEVLTFLTDHRVEVIVYDVARPVARHHPAFVALYQAATSHDCPLIISNTEREARDYQARTARTTDFVSKDPAIDDVVRAARRAVGAP